MNHLKYFLWGLVGVACAGIVTVILMALIYYGLFLWLVGVIIIYVIGRYLYNEVINPNPKGIHD